jgi:cardiolipin synthase
MRHIPNILSCIRILLIPLFVWQLQSDHTVTAAVILALSGLTDLLDGFLARRFNWVSRWGKILDPVADKLTQITVCFVLALKMRDYWFFFAVLLVKELIMLVLGGYLWRKKTLIEGARWFGKVFTTLFYVAMTVIVFLPSLPHKAVTGLLGLTAAGAVIASALYWPEFKRYNAGKIS